jgi:aminoglycoside phosphotransferase (APT) family kinase protein
MKTDPPSVAAAYTTVLERAILNMRMRIRYGETIRQDELHDFLDALHNIPKNLMDCGQSYSKERVIKDLAAYDDKWLNRPDSERRQSLLSYLENANYPELPQKSTGEQLG